MNRPKIVAGNWKMHQTFEEALQLARSLANASTPADVEVILAAPYVYLKSLVDLCLYVPNLSVAAQNCHHEAQGAFTGEIAASMLRSIHVPYAIVGHSERRQYAGEDDALIARKIGRLLSADIRPIYCCGESLSIRKDGGHTAYVRKQMEGALNALSAEDMQQVIIAYEPVWAIGTGETASPQQAQEMHASIRAFLLQHFGSAVAETTPILYGGSVKPANARALFEQTDVDGGLVGGASLRAHDFLAIIESFED